MSDGMVVYFSRRTGYKRAADLSVALLDVPEKSRASWLTVSSRRSGASSHHYGKLSHAVYKAKCGG